ncbi:translocation/assembly module TamB domain-containing protein [Calditrichota bacterium GD2]
MKKQKKWLAITKKVVLWALLFVAVLGAALSFLLWQASLISDLTRDFLNHQLRPHATVHYQSLEGSLFNNVRIKGLKITTQDSLILKSNYVEVRYRLLPLLKNRVEISKIIFEKLDIHLPSSEAEEAETSPANIDSLLASWQQYVSVKTLLGNLPDIRLNNLEILSGTLRLKGPSVILKNIKLNISRLKLKKDHIYLKLDNLSGDWPQRNLRLKSFSLTVNGDSTGITLNQGEIQTARSHLFFNALLSPVEGLNVNLTEFQINLSEFKALLNHPVPEQANIKGRLSFSGMPVHFGLQGYLKGQWQTQRVDSLAFHVTYNRGEIFLKRLLLNANFARLSAFAYWNQLKQISGEAAFKKVNLNLLSPALPPTRINGDLSLNAENLNFKKLTGKARLNLYHCALDTIEIDSIRLNVTATQGNYHIGKPSFIKVADSSRFLLQGTLDRYLQINFDLFTFNNRLNHTLRDLGLADLKGRMDGRIHLEGPLNNPDFSGNLSIPRLNYASIELDTIQFNVFIQGLSRERLGAGSFKILRGRIDKFPIDRVSFDLKTIRNKIEITDLKFLSRQNYFSTNLFINWQESLDSLSVKLFPFKVQYEAYWLKATDTLTITANPDEINLENFTLAGPQNSELSVNGFYNFELSDLQAYLTFNEFEIAPFEQFLKSNLNFRGRINGYIELLTPFTDLSIQSELWADSLFLQKIYMGRFSSDLYYAKDLFTVNDFMLTKDSTFLGLKGEFSLALRQKKFNLLEDTEVDLFIDWERLQLKHYAPLLKGIRRLRGLTSGDIAISGRVDAPQIKSRLKLDDFRIEEFSGDSLRLAMRYDREKIILDSLSLVLEGTSLKVSGTQDYRLSLVDFDADILNRPFELHVQSEDNHIFFLRNLIEEVESIQGTYNVDLKLDGTPLQPAVRSGRISLKNGQILLAIVRDPIANVDFDATIENHVLNIETFSARSVEEKDFIERLWRFLSSLLPWSKRSLREGYLTAKGTIDLHDLLRPKFDLALKMDEFYIDYFIQSAKLLLTTDNLKITGQDTLTISGNLYIPKAVVEIDLDQMARSVYLYEEVIKPEPPFLALNLDIEIPGNFTVTSSPLNLANNFRIIFMGDLQVTMEPPSDEPRILGRLEAISGKYASWNQNFIVQNATIDFKNKLPADPDIDVIAVKQLGNKKFELALNGSISNLTQQIRVFENGRELNLSVFDKISLLTLGADISTMQSNPDSALRDIGEKIATTSILTAVERSTEKFTGLDRVEINASGSLVNLSRFKLNNGLSDASIAFGKYLTSDLYVEYRTRFGQNIPAPRLSWDAGNRIGLQYRINRYWTLDSYYEKTERGNTRIRFGLNWEYSF